MYLCKQEEERDMEIGEIFQYEREKNKKGEREEKKETIGKRKKEKREEERKESGNQTKIREMRESVEEFNVSALKILWNKNGLLCTTDSATAN